MENKLQKIRGSLLIAWLLSLVILTPVAAQSNEAAELRLDAQSTLNSFPNTRMTLDSSDAIIDRSPDNPTGLISVKGNDNTGVYAADYFELADSVNLGQLRFYGFGSQSATFPSTLTGFNVIIYNHSVTVPDGNPESLGTGVLELLNITSDNFNFDNGTFTIDVPQANGGQEVTLPVGEYWISAFPTVSTSPAGDGRWNWNGSLSATPDFESVLLDPADLFEEGATTWTSISSIIGESFPSFAWTMTEVGGTMPVYCNFEITTSVEPITKVLFAGIDNSSSATSTEQIEDFTDIEGEVGQGAAYVIELEGFTDGPYDNYFTVWIDWNQDGVWDSNSDEMYEIGFITSSTGIDGIKATATINVPENAVLGSTSMRIIKNYNASPTDPCGSYSFGQAEDYTIVVTEPLPCEAVTNVEVTDIAVTEATINWTASPAATEGYIVDVYLANADPSADPTAFSETLVAGSVMVEVTELSPDTAYDVYVTSNCGDDENITSDVVTFTTEPTSSVGDFNLAELTVYPNPVSSDLNINASKVIEDVEIYNILGQRILKIMPTKSGTTIDVRDLSSGVYILKVTMEGAVNTVKFIKE